MMSELGEFCALAVNFSASEEKSMATKIIMPKLGMAMKEGMLAKWAAADGARVAVDDTIAVIVTKKITYELKAPVEGILHQRVKAKENRPVGAVIGYIAAPGEAAPLGEEAGAPAVELAAAAAPVAAPAQAPAAPEPAALQAAPGGFVLASPSARRMAREAGLELAWVTGSGPEGRVTEKDIAEHLKKLEGVLATPAARKLAQEHKLNLLALRGSGAGGRILEEDVLRAAGLAPAAGPALPLAAPPPIPAPSAVSAPATALPGLPMSGMRQMIAENMVSSLQTMAQVTITTEVDVTELVALRDRLKRDFELSYNDLIIQGAAAALRKHPWLNASLVDETIVAHADIHIGVGVALDQGLIVPVLRHADRLSLQRISERMRDLAARARQDALEIDEVSGGTFTITNLGAFGIDAFTPIINPPEAAILGVGRIQEKVVIYRGEIARRFMMVLSLTFDHRLVDGAPAAAFLQTLADVLTHPYLMQGK
jgi:pyruvate dehydrogenase E2 component (dihydrolipoamide acetyltransferase)